MSKSQSNWYKSTTNKLYIARKKLLFVIDGLLNSTSKKSLQKSHQYEKSYYLTVNQYNDAMWAADILKQVDDMKIYSIRKKIHMLLKHHNFNLNGKVRITKSGKILVDTPVLVQWINLYKILGEVIDFMQDIFANAYDFFVKDSSQEMQRNYGANKPFACLPEVPLRTNYIVMTANTVLSSNSPSQEEAAASRASKTSTGSTEKKSEVMDAQSAKKIIIRCIADLKNVCDFFENTYSDTACENEKSSTSQFVGNKKSIENYQPLLSEDKTNGDLDIIEKHNSLKSCFCITPFDCRSTEDAVEKSISVSRTKICSSMELDVHVVKSQLQSTHFRHGNTKVKIWLNDLGADNILRASRPAKCGRTAILNESSKKSLPYSPSLRSLPLDDIDRRFVQQSLCMSTNKVKHSRILIGKKDLKHSSAKLYMETNDNNPNVYSTDVSNKNSTSYIDQII